MWEDYNASGLLVAKYKWNMGTPIDTSYEYWDNGNLMEKEIYKNGKLIYNKCYSEKGKEISCEMD